MNEALDNLVKAVKKHFFTRQTFEYRFYQYDEKTEEKQIKIANSIEYEFINSGNSIIIINDRLRLFPEYMGVEPTRWKGTLNKNEVDNTVYEYRFEQITKITPIQGFDGAGGVATTRVWGLFDTDTLTRKAQYNLLQVIIKQVTKGHN